MLRWRARSKATSSSTTYTLSLLLRIRHPHSLPALASSHFIVTTHILNCNLHKEHTNVVLLTFFALLIPFLDFLFPSFANLSLSPLATFNFRYAHLISALHKCNAARATLEFPFSNKPHSCLHSLSVSFCSYEIVEFEKTYVILVYSSFNRASFSRASLSLEAVFPLLPFYFLPSSC